MRSRPIWLPSMITIEQLAERLLEATNTLRRPVHTSLADIKLTVEPGMDTATVLELIQKLQATPRYRAAARPTPQRTADRDHLLARFACLDRPIDWSHLDPRLDSSRHFDMFLWLLVCHHLWRQTAAWLPDQRQPFLDTLVQSEFLVGLLPNLARQVNVDLSAITRQFATEINASPPATN